MQLKDINTLVKYCIGNDSYRDQMKGRLADAIQSVSPAVVVTLLHKLNLSALFDYYCHEWLVDMPEYSRFLRPYLSLQNAFTDMLASEMSALGKSLHESACQPTLLKGPGLWGTVYPNRYHRRVKDLDVLIRNFEAVRVACGILEAHGYRSTGVNDEAVINTREHYELHPYLKQVRWRCHPEMESAIDWFHRNGMSQPTVCKRDAGTYDIGMEVELHKALFVRTDFTVPLLRPQDLDAYCGDDNYFVMKPAVNLAYLAVKYHHDRANHVSKAVKLLCDVVRILDKMSQYDLDHSIRVASDWGAIDELQSTLQDAAALMPDVAFIGMELQACDTVSTFVRDAMPSAADEGDRGVEGKTTATDGSPVAAGRREEGT